MRTVFSFCFYLRTNFTAEDQFVSDMTTTYFGKFAAIGDLTLDWDDSQHLAWPLYVRTF